MGIFHGYVSLQEGIPSFFGIGFVWTLVFISGSLVFFDHSGGFVFERSGTRIPWDKLHYEKTPPFWDRYIHFDFCFFSPAILGRVAHLNAFSYCIPPLKLTVRPWKSMVGRWISFWDPAYSQVLSPSGAAQPVSYVVRWAVRMARIGLHEKDRWSSRFVEGELGIDSKFSDVYCLDVSLRFLKRIWCS